VRTRFVLITLALLVLVSLPYIYAARAVGSGYVFGGFLFNPADGNSYLAKMYQGWRGDWLFTLPYTAHPGDGAFLFVFYIFLGHLARLFGFSLVWIFHLTRLLGALILSLALYRFLKAFSFDRRWKALIFAWAILGAGLGWLIFPFGVITADFWVAEAYPFLSSYANPHFALGLALLLFLFYPIQERSGCAGLWRSFWRVWPAGFVALLLAFVSPFGVIVALVILGGEWIREFWFELSNDSAAAGRSRIAQFHYLKGYLSSGKLPVMAARLLWIFLGGAPLLLYDFWIARVHPVLAGWNAQNLTPTPPLWDLLLALAPALALAMLGAWSLLRSKQGGNLLLTWALFGLLLVYLPFGLQRRFLMGLFVPVIGLAGFGLDGLATRVGRRSGLAANLCFAASLPTNLLLLFVAFHGIQTHNALLYLTRAESNALTWIEMHTPPHALILASPQTGMFIPAHTGRRVIFGHPFETVNAQAEERAVEQFFQSSGDVASLSAFLEQRGVDFVFYGPRERELGALPGLGNLLPVYVGGDVTIYQVVSGADRQGSG
jgi:hypothetical protein